MWQIKGEDEKVMLKMFCKAQINTLSYVRVDKLFCLRCYFSLFLECICYYKFLDEIYPFYIEKLVR